MYFGRGDQQKRLCGKQHMENGRKRTFKRNLKFHNKEYSMKAKPNVFKLKSHKRDADGERAPQEQHTQAQFYKDSYKRARESELQQKIKKFHFKLDNRSCNTENSLLPVLSPNFLLWLFVGTLFVQFCIQISLLVLEIISQKISVDLFCALLAVSFSLMIFVLISLCYTKSEDLPRLSIVSPEIAVEPEGQIVSMQMQLPTIANLKNGINRKDNEKTAKLRYPCDQAIAGNLDLQTKKHLHISKQKVGTKGEPISGQEMSRAEKNKVFLSGKLAQNLIVCVLISVCLGTIDDPTVEGFNFVVTLLILSYLLIILSSALAFRLYLFEPQRERAAEIRLENLFKNPNNPISEEVNEFPKPRTALSIEQHLAAQILLKRINIISIGPIESLTSVNKEKNKTFLKEQILKTPDQEEVQKKIQTQKNNKSVLKKTRTNKVQIEPQQDDKGSEEESPKRKVQINIQKIQYFEYNKSSPVNSLFEQSEEGGETRAKMNKNVQNGPNSRYQKHNKMHASQFQPKSRNSSQGRKKSKSASNGGAQQHSNRTSAPTFSRFRDLKS